MGGACVAQSVKCLTSAQVMISKFMGLRPASGSVLTAWSLEPGAWSLEPGACFGFCVSLSLPLPCLQNMV